MELIKKFIKSCKYLIMVVLTIRIFVNTSNLFDAVFLSLGLILFVDFVTKKL